jgi:aromatic-L-amino-acid decarboxylase
VGVSYFGTAVLGAAIDRGMDLAAHVERLVRADPELEVLSEAQFGICCFRARGRGFASSEVDAMNERILARVNGGGRYFISSTRLRGAYSLRICVLGFRTTREDVEGLIAEIAAYARE